jgi:hypothetical protein
MPASLSAWFAHWFGSKPLVPPGADVVTERWDDVPFRPGRWAASAVTPRAAVGDDAEWAAAIARAKAAVDTVTPPPVATVSPAPHPPLRPRPEVSVASRLRALRGGEVAPRAGRGRSGH